MSDVPTSYYGTEERLRFTRLNEEIFTIERQARDAGYEQLRLALYRARIELGHEESRFRRQYAERCRAEDEASSPASATEEPIAPQSKQGAA